MVPSDLRCTFAGDLLDSGIDLATVRALREQIKANTATQYDRRGERTKRARSGCYMCRIEAIASTGAFDRNQE